MNPEERARKEIDRHLRKSGWAVQDLFWLRDRSLEDSAGLPDPDLIAAEIADDLQSALDQFAAIANDLKAR